MADKWNHDYRLSLQTADFFMQPLERALAAGPRFIGEESRMGGSYGDGLFAIFNVFEEGDRPHFFDLHVHLPNGEVTAELTRVARELFSQIITMDDAARAIPRQHDENEELASVVLLPVKSMAVLHYYSTLWNSEWGVHFKRESDGRYGLVGIPKWDSPGEFVC